MAHKSHPCLVLSNTVGKGRPLYSLAGRGKEPKSMFTLQRAGVERDHCQKPWRYFSAVYHQWYIWVQTGRWQHSLLCSSSSPEGTCSPSCPDLSCPLLGAGSLWKLDSHDNKPASWICKFSILRVKTIYEIRVLFPAALACIQVALSRPV